MALSKKENAKKSRKYYQTNASYRKKRIEDRKEYYDEHRQSQNAYAREYYHSNPSYKKYKIAYARAYRKSHKK